ncbi:MAG: 2-phospho-L-lactate guanylyltransferase [Pseudonocardiales bacterium]
MPEWSLVIPVKRLEVAKTRLRQAVPGVEHDRLVLAICLDTVDAALRCPAVGRVLAVTDDVVAGEALRALGAVVVADGPDAGLNPALEHGAALATSLAPSRPVAVVSADLPALRPAELAAALAAAADHLRSFVADAAGTGTTLLAVAAGQALRPAYGRDSRSAHAASGAVELHGDWPSLRCDVDTPADLAAAAALGLGTAGKALLGLDSRGERA